MLPTFLVLFREVLEIALIVGIIMAATRGVAGRNRWVIVGLAGGIAGAGVVAYFAEAISSALEGMGQEVFNALVLLAAAFMIGWTVVWMKTHARQIVTHVKQVSKSIAEGSTPLYTVAIVVSLAMWREGSEVVLFMYGILSVTQESMLAIILGGIGGTLAAAAIGYMIYLGLIKLPVNMVFRVTGWVLILLACGMSAQSAGFFVQAGMIPELAAPLWDTSAFIAQESLPGRILHGMIGYTDRPSGMQALWYAVTFAILAMWMRSAETLYNRKISGNHVNEQKNTLSRSAAPASS